jgi:hypothetical protein
MLDLSSFFTVPGPDMFDRSDLGIALQVRRSMRYLEDQYTRRSDVKTKGEISIAYAKLRGELQTLNKSHQEIQ